MEESGRGGDPFPGFEMTLHNDDCVFRRSLSCRLQRQAPRPLLLPPRPPPSNTETSSFSFSSSSSSSSSSSAISVLASASAFGQNGTDPIPLLSPLVVPSMLQPNSTTTSH